MAVGDLQTGRDRARQGLAAGWGGSLLRGVASGVGISFKPWPWGGSLMGGGEVLYRYRSEKRKKKTPKIEKKNPTPASPSHHRINQFRASNRKPKRPKVSCFKQKTPKTERAKRKERAKRRRERKIFGRNERREKFSEQISVGIGRVRNEKY